MTFRKLVYGALKEKHHIPKSKYAIRSKVALVPVFIQVMELVFLSRVREFLVIFLQPCLPTGRLDFLLHFFIKKKVEEEISRVVTKKFNET